MMREKEISRTEREILTTLYWALRPLTTSQIAEKTGLSWNTAIKYLERLYVKKYVRRKKFGKAVYWCLTDRFL